MSECVVRMDHIPRNCLECPLNGQCGIFADWVCTLNSPARKHYPQPFDKGCNILAVLPEPHGRLVFYREGGQDAENHPWEIVL